MSDKDDKVQNDNPSLALADLLRRGASSLIKSSLEALEVSHRAFKEQAQNNKEFRENPFWNEMYAAIKTKGELEDHVKDGGKIFLEKNGKRERYTPESYKNFPLRDFMRDESPDE